MVLNFKTGTANSLSDSFGSAPSSFTPSAAGNALKVPSKAPQDTRELGKNIASILPKEREDKSLTPRDPLPPVDAQTGIAHQDPAWRKKGNIASPLTESSRTTVNYTVSDLSGVFTVTFAVAIQITMTDANGAQVVFNYDDPTT